MINIDNNRFGKIYIHKDMVNNIVRNGIAKLQGKLTLLEDLEYRNKVFKVANEYAHLWEESIQFNIEDDELYIELYLIFKFGASIKGSTEFLAKYIKENIESQIGIKVKEINLHIRGILLKKIVKRNIDISKTY